MITIAGRGSGRTGLAGLALVALVATACSGASHHAALGTLPSRQPNPAPGRQLLRIGLAGWQLPAALSRAVALPDGSDIVLAGGLTSAQTSADGVFTLNPVTGQLAADGSLAQPVHDAAGAVLNGRMLVVGGGTVQSVTAVQQLTPGGTATTLGQLPQPRSDLVATTIGNVAYVLGGYTGTTPVSAVLATTDGQRFSTVAQLPLTVRYPAIATLGGIIYLFGGEHDGVATADIQRIDPRTGSASVAGTLPTPLAHAAAFTLGQAIFLAGGRSGNTIDDAILRFDPARGALTPAGTLPMPVADSASATVAGVGYLIGGEDPDPVRTAMTLRLVTVAASAAAAGKGQPSSPSAGGPLSSQLIIVDNDYRDRVALNATPAGVELFAPEAIIPSHPYTG